MNARFLLPRRPRISSVACATLFFLIVGLVLTALMTHVVGTMVTSANDIDDARATRAAQASISSLKSRLSGVLRDNTVWDDAFTASTGSDAVGWAYENWGKTSADYPLYDAVVAVDQVGKPFSAYLDGQPFDPIAMFGIAFAKHIERAAVAGKPPVVEFLPAGNRVFLVASNAIQPFALEGQPAYRHPVLTMLKELTPEVLAAESVQYDLKDLRLAGQEEPGRLNQSLVDANDKVIGYLSWNSQRPGLTLFKRVEPYIYSAIAILLVFLVGVLVVGAVESKRLAALAAVARHEATHDSLTGLHNRAGLLQTMSLVQNTRADDGMLTLHMIDLDGFKAVNDAWGHAVGDELIRRTAAAITDLHTSVAGVARLGGDEFALVQQGSTLTDLDEAVLDIFRTPFEIGGRIIEVGASIGTACATAMVEPLEILRRADMALYRAKEDGRGRVVRYDPALDVEREHLALLESDLRAAIASGAITPVFQPLVSAVDGSMHGVEALARWDGPRGQISPEVFIPLAEKAGLIDALGRHMLVASLAQAKRWPDLYLSVNVSPLQLCSPDFAHMVSTALETEGFNPKRLTLEITEGVLMSNPDQARRSINALKTIGVRFALDDFGCGYASIGALRTFGFDRVKIDRSLVTALEEKSNGEDVLKATILLAIALDIPVTAEGIENLHQAQILSAAGCDQLQGYLMGRPMQASEIDLQLREQSGLGGSRAKPASMDTAA